MALGSNPSPPPLSTERERKIAAAVVKTCTARGISYSAACTIARILARPGA